MMAGFFSSFKTWPGALLMGLVKAYRLFIGPTLSPGCRFEPSCSSFSLQALQQHGALGGSYLTLHRLVRCQPWCEGGHDPVPATLPRLFRFTASTSTQKNSS